jgi:hypothetical protein
MAGDFVDSSSEYDVGGDKGIYGGKKGRGDFL